MGNRFEEYTVYLKGLTCASCAGKIERAVEKMDEVESANFNMVNEKFRLSMKEGMDKDKFNVHLQELVDSIENGVKVEPLHIVINEQKKHTVYLKGLHCASCAGKIENAVNKLEGISEATFNMVNEKFTMKVQPKINIKDLEEDIQKLVDSIENGVTLVPLQKGQKVKVRRKSEPCCSGHEHEGGHEHGHIHSHGTCSIEDFHEHSDRTVKEGTARVVFEDLRENVLDEEKGIFRFINKEIALIGVYILCLLLLSSIRIKAEFKVILYIILYILAGKEVLLLAGKNILKGEFFDENFLMSVATIGAIIVKQYPEAISIMLFYQVGEYLQKLAVDSSRKSVAKLLEIKPEFANLLIHGNIEKVAPESVNVGDIVLVKPGEKIPLDGKIIKGLSYLDTSNITGESIPRKVEIGDEVVSGCVNLQGILEVEVLKIYAEGTISKIIEMVENASSRKSKIERFITRFSKIYTPIVVGLAFLIGIVYPLIFNQDLSVWLYRACVFLVISCPCALVVSVPLGVFGGIGAASKRGIFIKGGNYLEAIGEMDTLVFDKTGTITKGVFKVAEISSYSDSRSEEVLKLAAYGEYYSNHPIALAIKESYGEKVQVDKIKDFSEKAGEGIIYTFGEDKILIGNKELFRNNNIELKGEESNFTVVNVGKNGVHIGTLILSDELKEGIKVDIDKLSSRGIKTAILSGDNNKIVEEVLRQTGITKGFGELLPTDKVYKLEDIMKSSNKKVAFVGDGVNDAPVLARADVGIAMGKLGSDCAVEAADVVLMTDEIGKINDAIDISRFSKKVVSQNIFLALFVKLVVLILGAWGMATMWEAVFSDVGVTLIAVLNAMRVLKSDY